MPVKATTSISLMRFSSGRRAGRAGPVEGAPVMWAAECRINTQAGAVWVKATLKGIERFLVRSLE